MKQLTAFLLAMLMIATPLGVMSGSAISSEPAIPEPTGGGSFGGGDGSVLTPYLIEDALDLQAMNLDLGANYSLTNDIDASETSAWNGGQGFIPVGNNTSPFNGTLNGNSNIISSLHISRDGNYQGLFGQISSTAKVENLNLEDVYINAWQFRGAVAGYNNGGIIRNCTSSGIIGYASSNAGGLVGRTVGGIIDNCSSSCSVSSTNGNNIGGLVGQASGGSAITDSWSTEDVQGQANIGGFIGAHEGDGTTITGCFASGDVTANDRGGGFVGQNRDGADIYNSYASGDVSVVSNNGAGGFVGNHLWTSGGTAIIRRCYASGNVESLGSVGGFVGTNTNGGAVIYDCYALGNAIGTFQVGGFVGSEWDGPIERCYSAGTVTGTSDAGGFAGWSGFNVASAFLNNRWDNETSGTTIAVGNPQEPGDDAGIAGNTTAQLLQQSTYTGFNFNTVWWNVNASTRPFLRMEWGQEIHNSHQLQLMQMDLAVDYTLAWDIDLSDIIEASQMWGTNSTQGGGFVPVAYDTEPGTMNFDGTMFTGTFDGKGHSVTGLFINRSTNGFQGLFGCIFSSAKLENVNMVDVNITGDYYVGGLYGANNNLGSASNVTVSGSIRGNQYLGGLTGQNTNNAVLTNISTNMQFFDGQYVGGIAGRNAATITGCDAQVIISNAVRWVGGIAGNNDGSILNCSASGQVEGNAYEIGGIAGLNTGAGSISGCGFIGSVNGMSSPRVGGVVGLNQGSVDNCSFGGWVTANSDVGGIIGNNAGGTVTGSTSSGDVSGTSNYVGGFVGYNDASATISYCNSTGTANGLGGGEGIGGFVGANYGDIATCFSTGDAIGNAHYVGGFVGYNHGGATISSCNSTGTAYGLGMAVDIGGFAGSNEGNIDNCSSTGDAVGNGNTVGGFAGNNNSPITNCHAHGNASGTDYVGGFAGYNWAEVINCHSTGNASGNDYVGGFIGYSGGSPITNCTSTGSVTGDWYLGGFIGYSGDSPITNCSSTGSVTGTVTGSRQGGFVGENHAPITNCSSAGNITGCDVAGFVGINMGPITDCHSTGNVNGTGNAVGGFVGLNEDNNITRCFSTGDVTGLEDVGGFAGDNVGGNITECYSIGNAVSISAADSFVGGFIGVNAAGGNISDCYGWGAASGAGNYGGGFAAGNYVGSAITNCYSIGTAGAAALNGGFAYVNTGTITDCFWDSENSGNPTSVDGVPKNTAEMMQEATFNPPWDFTAIWGIYEHNTYPFLRAFGMPPEPQADLEVTLEDLADPIMFGDVLTYHATLTNHGPGNAVDVKVNVTLPTEVSLLNTSAGMTVNGRWITGDPGTVANGEIQHLFINVTVISNGTGILNCTAFVTASTMDPGFYPNETFELTGINHAPTAENKSWQCTEDGAWYLYAPGVLWGAGDPDSDPVTVLGHEPSDYGAAITILADGNFTYDPTVSATLQALRGGVSVYDTFNYTVSDGRGGFATALITMQVDGQEGYPTAVNDTYTVQEDSGTHVMDVLQNDIADEEGDAITILGVYPSVIWQGTVAISADSLSLSFTPTANYNGVVFFNYTIHIASTSTGTGMVMVTVLNVNDPPVIYGTDENETLTGWPYLVNYTATDADGDTLTWSLTTNASWLSINASGSLSGIPENADAGTYSVSVRVSDGHGGHDWSNFTLTVLLDTDGDGIPDSEDPDDDGDGVADADDLDPLDPEVGAEAPPLDTDSDGVPDSEDAFPTDPAASVDADDDGYPDAWNPGYTAEDSTTGLELDDDPLVPHEEGGGSNAMMYLIIIIVIVAVIAVGVMLARKGPKEPAEAPEVAVAEPEQNGNPNEKTQ